MKKREGSYGDAIAIDRVLPETKIPQGLKITFKRTIRVPDNEEVSNLPPGLGSFPLFKVQDYAARLPKDMVDKRGLFFPMYQKEAMWIHFESTAPFMIKIYCGGVNAISGEHSNESAGTQQRRSKLAREDASIQDYVVVPSQPWLDGVAVKPSVVRQFVAMPMGHGYSVEAQVTGKETVGGLQLEVTPALCTSFFSHKQQLLSLTGIRQGERSPEAPYTVGELLDLYQDFDGQDVHNKVLPGRHYRQYLHWHRGHLRHTP